MAEQAPQQDERPTEPCAWCGEPSVTRLIVASGKKGTRAPVCVDHERQFIRQGAETERSLFDKKHGSKGGSGRPVIK